MATLWKPAEALGRQNTNWRLQPEPQGAAKAKASETRAAPQDVGNHRLLEVSVT